MEGSSECTLAINFPNICSKPSDYQITNARLKVKSTGFLTNDHFGQNHGVLINLFTVGLDC